MWFMKRHGACKGIVNFEKRRTKLMPMNFLHDAFLKQMIADRKIVKCQYRNILSKRPRGHTDGKWGTPNAKV